MEGQRDLHATIDTHYIPYPPTIYTTLAGYGIAERDGERRESGRRACLRIGTACDIRCGAGLVCDTMRARTACVLTDRDGVRATDRDDERHGAGPDGERTVGTAFDMRCGYDRRVRTVRFGTMCERDGAGAAGVAGRVHGFGATGGDTDLYGRLRVSIVGR